MSKFFVKICFTLLIIILNAFAFSQRIYKDKTATLSAIEEKGYSYAQDQASANVYWYKRYDTYGESIVQLTFDGNYLRKAVIVHLDPTQTLQRLRDVYAKTTDAESETFDPPANGRGQGVASNTPYYTGRARYECNNNYSTRDYLFIIMPLD